MRLLHPAGRLLLAVLCALASPAPAQQRTMVPVVVDGEALRLAIITHRPAGAGPFPTLVFHHGSSGGGRNPAAFARPYEAPFLASWFVARGWAVVLPARRGRGGSEGLYDEGFMADRSQGYSCDEARLLAGAEHALRDIDAVMPAILALPFVDRARIAVGGHSRGGILALAWAGRHPEQARAVLNFVGGWRSTACETAATVNRKLFTQDAARAPPSLWLYGARDPFYAMASSRANFAAFQAAGGHGTFHECKPPRGYDGHSIDELPFLWAGTVKDYLVERGLPVRSP